MICDSTVYKDINVPLFCFCRNATNIAFPFTLKLPFDSCTDTLCCKIIVSACLSRRSSEHTATTPSCAGPTSDGEDMLKNRTNLDLTLNAWLHICLIHKHNTNTKHRHTHTPLVCPRESKCSIVFENHAKWCSQTCFASLTRSGCGLEANIEIIIWLG